MEVEGCDIRSGEMGVLVGRYKRSKRCSRCRQAASAPGPWVKGEN